MKAVTTLAALAALAATELSAQQIVGRDETTWSVTHRLSAGDWVRVASMNGTVRVTEARGSEVEIRATKDIRKGSVEDVGFVVRKGSGGITVCAVWDDEDECSENGDYRGGDRPRGWWNRHQARVDFIVSVPASARIRVQSGNGDVMVNGVGAEVVASSGNGRVTVEGATGPVDVSSGNGDIRVTTTAGPVEASSGNGDIDVVMDRIDGSPDMDFTTGNGRITLTVPDNFGAELTSHTGNGRVDVDFPIQMRGRIDPSRLRGTIGKGGGRLSMSSGNGNLQIRHRP